MLGKRAVDRGDRLAVSQARISSAPRTRDAHARARKFSVALDVPPSDSDDRHGVKRRPSWCENVGCVLIVKCVSVSEFFVKIRSGNVRDCVKL